MEKRNIKLLFIILSLVMVLFSTTDNIISSGEGAVSLKLFESFYIYLVTIAISIYDVFDNRKSTIPIILSLLTYVWTYFLIHQMVVTFTELHIVLEMNGYIYFASAIFLIISLFVGNKKTSEPDTKSENIKQLSQQSDALSNNQLNEDYFLFANFVVGIKEIPYNNTVLLVNNLSSNTIDLVYSLNDETQTRKFSLDQLKNISYTGRVRTSNLNKKVEENGTRSVLLSTVMFGGNPVMQMAGNHGFEALFDTLSNNYDKNSFNSEFEVVIEFEINMEKIKLVFISDKDPKNFINQISK